MLHFLSNVFILFELLKSQISSTVIYLANSFMDMEFWAPFNQHWYLKSSKIIVTV